MLFGLIALVLAALFAGAAIYISLVEQPARMELEAGPLLTQWKPAYKRGAAMQAPLAALAFLAGALAWRELGDWRWLAGAVLMGLNWPWTLLAVGPVNNLLLRTDPAHADADIRTVMARWGGLHAVRAVLGAAATLLLAWGAYDEVAALA